ncbi:patatin group A-2-like [Neltuma alba]|uniref:patatin group A-2-like n=1 Tax=Neltuma alba TaxID=207710 RepID=UPI0010A377FE|nr:patatin group A-2-like [Prosopis alba]
MAVEDDEQAKIRVLAIDGGSMKGVLPGVILQRLAASLQKRNPNAKIGEYFDVAAGTSTGGIITAILTGPDPQNKHRPPYSADEIVKFYRDHGPSVFNEVCYKGIFCPKFSRTYLRQIAAEMLGETLINQTTTCLPSTSSFFNQLYSQASRLLRYKGCSSVKRQTVQRMYWNISSTVRVSALYFEYQNTEFNLVDGPFIASMPARLAVSEVFRQEEYKNREIILLPLGTGNYT